MKKMKKSLIVASAVLLAACGASKMVVPTQGDADRMSSKFEGGYTLADLEKGKVLYENNCGICHTLHAANSRVEAAWNQIVPNMVAKVNKKSGKEALNAADEELIRRYLVTMCTK